MTTVTRTINPLPFEHLEPKRFEDLIRQLAYDFKTWRSLEATGRSGSDDGYDIRGWEIIRTASIEQDEETDEAIEQIEGEDRIWLIQCKREQEIGPKKLGEYLDAIPDAEKARLHGLIIAASCNISKKARDLFIEKCGKAGISECYIWSRAEIEDMLFQPKNDGILFAYFGISLTIRRRSLTSQLRTRLSTKRKLIRTFGGGAILHKCAVFLDPTEEQYPYSENMKYDELPWKIQTVSEHHPLGLMIVQAKFLAFLDDDGVHWDAANAFNDYYEIHENPWADRDDEEKYQEQRNSIFSIQYEWPQQNRATLTTTCLLRYEEILDVDRDGDSLFRGPIIYVAMSDNKIPFSGGWTTLTTENVYASREGDETFRVEIPGKKITINDGTKRIEKFPKQYRKLK